MASSKKTFISTGFITPSYTPVSTEVSSASQLNTVCNATPFLSRTIQFSGSTRRSQVTPLQSIEKHDPVSKSSIRTPESFAKVLLSETMKTITPNMDNTNTPIITFSMESQYKRQSHKEFSASVSFYTAVYPGSSSAFKQTEPCRPGKCAKKEDELEKSPSTIVDEFRLTLSIKFGFFAAGMAIPVIITLAVAVYSNFR